MLSKQSPARIYAFVVLLLFGYIQPACYSDGTTYYVSSSVGNDQWDGLAAEWDGSHGPMRTLSQASALVLAPGDNLLLRCGDQWQEMLTLRGSGLPGNEVTLASYGEGERPKITRETGRNNVCLLIDGGSFFRLRDLCFSTAQNGVRLDLSSAANPQPQGYLIEGCVFEDISNPGFPDIASGEGYSHHDLQNMGWAVFFNGLGSENPILLRDLTVRNCVASYTQGFFIQMGPVGMEQVLFEGNSIVHNSYNSLYQIAATDFDIRNNVFVYSYPWNYHPAGATQVIAGGLTGNEDHRNEVVGNEFGWAGDYPGCPDGCSYDFETPCDAVTFQNNFIHNSFGEAVLFMGGFEHHDLLFDNNIFLNNVRFSPRWNVEIALHADNTGSGVFSNNRFFSGPDIHPFASQPESFEYHDNVFDATGSFAEMPMVTRITVQGTGRSYEVASRTPEAQIRYTRDGSVPTLSSSLYTEPVHFQRSGVLNLKAFGDSSFPSYVNSLVVDLSNREGSTPVAWWKLNEEVGPSVIDSVGDNPGTINQAERTAGRHSGALAFDGISGHVDIAHGCLRSITDTFTVSFWAEPTEEHRPTDEANTGIGVSRLAWWPLDEGQGATVADQMGSSAGTIAGAVWSDGKYGPGLAFDGEGARVNVFNSGLRAVSDTFTISFWANPLSERATTAETNQGISGWYNDQRFALAAQQYPGSSGEAGVGVSVGTNGLSVFELADNHLPSLLVADLDLSGWNQITVVFRDKQPEVYINGGFVKTGFTSTKVVHPTFSFGGAVFGWYQGGLDEVRVYPRALQNEEIQALATGGPEPEIKWLLPDQSDGIYSRDALVPVTRGSGPDASHAGIGVSVATNGIHVFERSDNYWPALLVDPCPLQGWNHITVVYRNKQPTLYLNGVYEKAGCKSLKTVHPVFDLGGSSNRWYAGKLDEVRVYDRVLTDAEIQELASADNAAGITVR